MVSSNEWPCKHSETHYVFKFLGIHITDKLNWSTHTDSIVKKAQQRLFNLRRLKRGVSAL
jgi:hypothetical protein